MQQDTIDQLYGSTIQHGHHNDRIYLMHLEPEYTDALIAELEKLALSRKYGKIFAKIPMDQWKAFEKAGYIKEAEIPCFYAGEKTCCFGAMFFGDRQKTEEDFSELNQLLQKKKGAEQNVPIRSGKRPSVKKCTFSEADELATFYRDIFVSYPFPLTSTPFIRLSMREKCNYYYIREEGKIVAAAAADIDKEHQYAEMTDFATTPSFGGKGLATLLLHQLERDLDPAEVKTVFTIARSRSLSMNRVFQKRGYTYSGLLINNTQIAGRIESMTVWYKHLSVKNIG